MTIEMAKTEDLSQVQQLDRHIPLERLSTCIENGQVYVLRAGEPILGILRFSLFWQSIPFLDLIFLDASIHGQGFGTQLMNHWENQMARKGYDYVMTSTQEDETAWQFYEKLGYVRIGSFLPPEQEAPELMYGRALRGNGL